MDQNVRHEKQFRQNEHCKDKDTGAFSYSITRNHGVGDQK